MIKLRKTEEFVYSFDSCEKAPKASKAWSTVYEWLDSPIYAILLILLLFTFACRIVGVNGESMMPTLKHGDWLTVSSVTKDIEAGDIVVITQPNGHNEPLIKRVIATGGDEIDIDFTKHTVSVNGVALDEPYIAEPTADRENFRGPIRVPEGKLFVMGDNRNESSDSRSDAVGLIDERYVLGVAQVRLFPFGDWKL